MEESNDIIKIVNKIPTEKGKKKIKSKIECSKLLIIFLFIVFLFFSSLNIFLLYKLLLQNGKILNYTNNSFLNKNYSFLNKNYTEIQSNKTNIDEEKIYLDQYETNIFNKIKPKIDAFKCYEMWSNHHEFLNGMIRKFRPKKVVEIGVRYGCASAIILNALQDINGSHLYSIDLSNDPNVGKCVPQVFPNYMAKWTLYKGNVASKFIEEIGKDIDAVFIDSAHFEPGEILDFIIVLPFLREKAIVGFHDIANQQTLFLKGANNWLGKRNEWAPYIIFNVIKGKTYLPSGNKVLWHDIGAKRLDINQKQYYHDYFRLLGGQWQYFPKEEYIEGTYELFKKYYDNDCLTIYNETANFNRKFVKANSKPNLYRYNSN